MRYATQVLARFHALCDTVQTSVRPTPIVCEVRNKFVHLRDAPPPIRSPIPFSLKLQYEGFCYDSLNIQNQWGNALLENSIQNKKTPGGGGGGSL
jgi:hypothetical protein